MEREDRVDELSLVLFCFSFVFLLMNSESFPIDYSNCLFPLYAPNHARGSVVGSEGLGTVLDRLLLLLLRPSLF